MNSSNTTVSSSSSSNGPYSKESNYASTEYVKDRNVFVTAGKKTSTLTTTKFNQKNSGSGRESSVNGSNTTKNNRRNGANNVPEKGTNKKSYSPSVAKRRSGGGGSSINADDVSMGMGANHQIGSSSTFTSKSISSYVSWQMDNQRIAKRQIAYQNIKHGVNNKNAEPDEEDEKADDRDDDPKENDEPKINVVLHAAMDSNDNIVQGNVDLKSSSSSVSVSLGTSSSVAMLVGGSSNNNNSQDGNDDGDSVAVNNANNINNVPKMFVINHRLGHEPQQQQQPQHQPASSSMVNHKKFHDHAINYDDEPKMAYLHSSDSTNLIADSVDGPHSHRAHHRRPNGNNGNDANNNIIVDTFDGPPPSTMELECVAGYDGGLPQYFRLEAYDSRTKKLRLNISSAFTDIPVFRIDLAGMCVCHSQPIVHLLK